MSHKQPETVAIIGGGPAGATLGCLLAQAGLKVCIFHNDKRPDLIVGESLIPAIVPLIQKLGLEKEVASFSVYKPGATINLYPDNMEWNLDFSQIEDAPTGYSYNVPRDKFDALLLAKAQELGCQVVRKNCKLNADIEADKLIVADLEEEFDFIFDASGRKRISSQLLGIDSIVGDRNDVALFAHLDKGELSYPGYLHITILEDGWSWRIPLADKLSVGIVAPSTYLARFGKNAQEQFDNILVSDPTLAPFFNSSTRKTSVAKYSNYQLESSRMYGTNWAMLGDAAGFVDPIFSSGLFISLYGAQLLAENLIESGTEGLENYQKQMQAEFALWRQLIASFYDSRFFNLIRHANLLSPKAIKQLQTGRTVGLLLAGFGYQHPNLISSFEWILDFCKKYEQSVKIGKKSEAQAGSQLLNS